MQTYQFLNKLFELEIKSLLQLLESFESLKKPKNEENEQGQRVFSRGENSDGMVRNSSPLTPQPNAYKSLKENDLRQDFGGAEKASKERGELQPFLMLPNVTKWQAQFKEGTLPFKLAETLTGLLQSKEVRTFTDLRVWVQTNAQSLTPSQLQSFFAAIGLSKEAPSFFRAQTYVQALGFLNQSTTSPEAKQFLQTVLLPKLESSLVTGRPLENFASELASPQAQQALREIAKAIPSLVPLLKESGQQEAASRPLQTEAPISNNNGPREAAPPVPKEQQPSAQVIVSNPQAKESNQAGPVLQPRLGEIPVIVPYQAKHSGSSEEPSSQAERRRKKNRVLVRKEEPQEEEKEDEDEGEEHSTTSISRD